MLTVSTSLKFKLFRARPQITFSVRGVSPEPSKLVKGLRDTDITKLAVPTLHEK